MTQDPIKCDVCSVQMSSQKDILRHIQLHLSQINQLLNRSLAHRSPEPSKAPRDWKEGDDPPSTRSQKLFKCPRENCDHGAFRRRQELLRHYATHYKLNTSCVCFTTFHLASKYIYHKCTGEADHQQGYTKRWEALCEDVERELDQAVDQVLPSSGLRKKRAMVSSGRRKRRKTENPGDPPMGASAQGAQLQLQEAGSTAQGAPLQLPEDAGRAVQGQACSNGPLLPIPGTSLSVLVGSDQSTSSGCVNNNPQPYDATEPPVFWDHWDYPYPDAQPWVP